MRVGEQLQLPANATIPDTAARTAITIPIDQLYLVQPGDTLLTIAEKKALLPEELRVLNPGTDWEKLKIGQAIRAP